MCEGLITFNFNNGAIIAHNAYLCVPISACFLVCAPEQLQGEPGNTSNSDKIRNKRQTREAAGNAKPFSENNPVRNKLGSWIHKSKTARSETTLHGSQILAVTSHLYHSFNQINSY
jgi:hypothetical protein